MNLELHNKSSSSSSSSSSSLANKNIKSLQNNVKCQTCQKKEPINEWYIIHSPSLEYFCSQNCYYNSNTYFKTW